VQGHRLGAAAIERLTARLAAMSLAERARLPVLEVGRADVIVPGGIVVSAALAGLGLPFVVVSDAGLREGILLDAVGWRQPGREAARPIRESFGLADGRQDAPVERPLP
jgi:exopolyphosphatase/guanosine-5'-triphosphate,3'-diphosphate pyrophosphatase